MKFRLHETTVTAEQVVTRAKLLALALMTTFACEDTSGRSVFSDLASARLQEREVEPGGGVLPSQLPDSEQTVRSRDSITASPGEQGAKCRLDSDCDSQACVDGYCCASECEDVCATCAAPGLEGTCSPAASDYSCPVLVCPAATECLKYSGELSQNCAGVGQCKVTEICAERPEPEGTACGVGAEGTCDGAGACVVPEKESLGESCADNSDCAEGHCVRGEDGAQICCATACNGECEVCSSTGRCDSVPDEDPRCDRVECPDDNACRDYPTSLNSGQCRALGQCQDETDCRSRFTPLRAQVSCACGVDGDCSLRPGETCAADSQCGGGDCVLTGRGNSVCCTEVCGVGLFCARDGRGCVECEGASVTCSGNEENRCFNGGFISRLCANGCIEGEGCAARAPIGASCAISECQLGAVCQTTGAGERTCCERDCRAEGGICTASGRCECRQGKVFNGEQCVIEDGNRCLTNLECASGSCQPDGLGAERCCSQNCAADGRFCGQTGSCQCPRGKSFDGRSCVADNGDSCDTSAECESGNCVDGICCAEACDGACERCQAQTGQCVALTARFQDELCDGVSECNGSRQGCGIRTGEICSGNLQCLTGNCVRTGALAAKECSDIACEGERPYSAEDGTQCVQCTRDSDCSNTCNLSTGTCNPEAALGTFCQSSRQCSGATSVCTASRCCEFNCASEGKVCNSSGRCQCPSGSSASVGGTCIEQADTVPPTIAFAEVTGQAFGLTGVQLSFQSATDNRTPTNNIEYAVLEALAPIPAGLPIASLLSLAQPGGAGLDVNMIRQFEPGRQFGVLIVPDKAYAHHFVVLARDAQGNMARYNPTSVDYEAQEPSGACSSNNDCVEQCATFYQDADQDCWPNTFASIKRCVGIHTVDSACEAGEPMVFSSGARYILHTGRPDCNDQNDEVFPSQTKSFAVPFQNEGRSSYDYNCDGNETLVPRPEFAPNGYENGHCNSHCDQDIGYEPEADCGDSPRLLHCAFGAIGQFGETFCNPVAVSQTTLKLSCL